MEQTLHAAPSATAYGAMRAAMVASQLRPGGVSDARLVAALATVPREAFLPFAVAELAYRDMVVTLGNGRMSNLPIATGRLLNEARLQPTDTVLLVGAAGGYAAAVLAAVVARVVAVESDSALLAIARPALASLSNVTLVEAPLAAGQAASAPYDVIIIDGAVEEVPQVLVDQLAVGGRMTTGLVDNGVTRLAAGRRTEGGFALAAFADLDCAVLPGFAEPKGFVF
ncbi:MAG: protein-L-isoaspartate O-methyltransferase family protein [Sphingomonas sp.]